MDSDILLGRYIIQDTLGAGSGGVVNLAWDTRIRRNVAIKRIKLPRHQMGSAVPGLEEARTGAQLHDSRIVNVYDFEVEGGEALLIMEFVDGMSLGDIMDRIPRMLTHDEVASIAQNVGKALQHAHKNHVLHLDVKPDNILVDSSGTSKVTDFGIARLAKGSGFGAATAGTIGYMPPEQLRGEQVDERSDQWAFAAMLYELLVGDNPFIAGTFMESLDLVETSEIYLPSSIVDELDPKIDDVLFRALSPNPDDRYDSVSDLVSDLLPHLGKPKTGRSSLSGLVGELGQKVVLGSPEDRITAMISASGKGNYGTAPTIADVDDDYDDQDDDLYFDDEEPAYAGAFGKTVVREDYDERKWVRRRSFRDIVDESRFKIAGRVVGALSSGAIAWLGASSAPLPWPITTLVAALAVGAVGAISPSIGAVVSLALLGVGAIYAGWLPQGIIILVLTAIWWMAEGRRGVAESNCATLAPSAGLIGMAMISPIACGYFLSMKKAMIASGFGVAVMLIAFPITASSELWSLLPSFLDSNSASTGAFLNIYNSLSLWTWAAGWVCGALAMSMLANRGSKMLSLLGVALCIGIIIASKVLGISIAGEPVGFGAGDIAAFALPPIAGIVMVWLCESPRR